MNTLNTQARIIFMKAADARCMAFTKCIEYMVKNDAIMLEACTERLASANALYEMARNELLLDIEREEKT